MVPPIAGAGEHAADAGTADRPGKSARAVYLKSIAGLTRLIPVMSMAVGRA